MSTIPTARRSHPAFDFTPASPHWTDAVCIADPEMFFLDDMENREAREATADAKAACRDLCPLLEACRTYALTNPDMARDGVWGGLTAAERGGGTDARLCETCMKLYRPKKHNQRYCTRACYAEAKAAKQPEYNKRRKRG